MDVVVLVEKNKLVQTVMVLDKFNKYLQQAILAGYQADSQVADALSEALRAAGGWRACGKPSDKQQKPAGAGGRWR